MPLTKTPATTGGPVSIPSPKVFKKEVCRDFQNKKCRRGDKCPRLHEIPTSSVGKNTDCPPPQTPPKRYVRLEREPSSNSDASFSSFDESHESSVTSSTDSIATPVETTSRVWNSKELCRDFARGCCLRKPCHYVHKVWLPHRVCRDFYFRTCPRGRDCHLEHRTNPNRIPPAELQNPTVCHTEDGTLDCPDNIVSPSSPVCDLCRLGLCGENHNRVTINISQTASIPTLSSLGAAPRRGDADDQTTSEPMLEKAPHSTSNSLQHTNTATSPKLLTPTPEGVDPKRVGATAPVTAPSGPLRSSVFAPRQNTSNTRLQSPPHKPSVRSPSPQTKLPPSKLQDIPVKVEEPAKFVSMSPSTAPPAPPRPDVVKVNLLDTTWVEFTSGFEVMNVSTAFETRWVALDNVPSSTSARALNDVVGRFGEVTNVIGLDKSESQSAEKTNGADKGKSKRAKSVSMPNVKSRSISLPGSASVPVGNTRTVRVQFASTTSAAEAAATLHGARAFKQTISARLLHEGATRRTGSLDNLTVRLSWPLPCRHALVGYASQEAANRVICEVNRTTLRDFPLSARTYAGVPTLGQVNVRIEGLPADTTEEEIRAFGKVRGVKAEMEGLLLQRASNYTSVEESIRAVTHALETASPGQLVTLDVLPPPYREFPTPGQVQHSRFNGPPIRMERMIRGYAHFLSPAGAATACATMNGFRQTFLGGDALWAAHVQSVSYRVPKALWDVISGEVWELRRAAWRLGARTNVHVLDWHQRRENQLNHQRSASTLLRSNEVLEAGDSPAGHPMVRVRLSGESVAAMAHLKAIFETMLRGERVADRDGQLLWTDYFSSRAGNYFADALRSKHRAVSIHFNYKRRFVTLHGSASPRASVRTALMAEVEKQSRMKVTALPLVGRSIDLLLNPDFLELQKEYGSANVFLDLWNRRLEIRGGEKVVSAAKEAVRKAEHKTYRESSHRDRHRDSSKKEDLVTCPVCLHDPTQPTTLPCGHVYCQACLKAYFQSASTNQSTVLPIRCIATATGATCGTDTRTGNCQQCIPLFIARAVLSPSEFETVALAAFTVHVRTHPTDFHYCPSEECDQVFRTPPKGALVQCPSCLTSICADCCGEMHEGTTCSSMLPHRSEGSSGAEGDRLFEEWRASHDVKFCPGCRAPIEKNAGCNHILCTRCQTHICWVCLETFGEKAKGRIGIYDHMRNVHGGIGADY